MRLHAENTAKEERTPLLTHSTPYTNKPSKWELSKSRGVAGKCSRSSCCRAISDSDYSQSSFFRSPMIPAATKALASTDVREKGLKVVQYAAKLLHYYLSRANPSDPNAKRAKAVSKWLSTGRRLMKLLRWIKYFGDLEDAEKEEVPALSTAMYVAFGAGVFADTLQDALTLEKIGVLKKGTLPPTFERYANSAELIVAVIGITTSVFKVSRGQAKVATAIRECKAEKTNSAAQKVFLAQLGLIKNACDTVRSVDDLELAGDLTLGVGLVCGLMSGALSGYTKVLKAVK